MVGGQNIFDQPVKNDTRTYDNIRKITTGLGDDDLIVYLIIHTLRKTTR